MIKLVVTDLDGTLLNNQRELSNVNENTIRKLLQENITICFATGRPLQGITKFIDACELTNFDSYSITNTGACVYSNKKFKLLSSNYLNEKEYNTILNHIKENDIQLAGYSDFDLYSFSEKINSALIHDSKILSMPITTTTFASIKNPVCRLNIMGDKKEIDQAIECLPQDIFDNYYTVRNETFSFELLNKNSGKGNAIKYLMNYLGLKKEEVLVVGDNFNDVDMLVEAGISVAMGQSHPDIKKVCTYITDTNENDGFTKAIEDIIFNSPRK
ncbi:Cof-type HAD-IIB family hydrolase [Anaerorhabdus sp.]|uniref:Cof-type HAD-IIB family hydrolase n=1 Tax=Anaerorhabdus sp. TaxID=1872524 RepID=UPI002FC8AD91